MGQNERKPDAGALQQSICRAFERTAATKNVAGLLGGVDGEDVFVQRQSMEEKPAYTLIICGKRGTGFWGRKK